MQRERARESRARIHSPGPAEVCKGDVARREALVPFLTSLSSVRCGTQPSKQQDPVFVQLCHWAGADRRALLPLGLPWQGPCSAGRGAPQAAGRSRLERLAGGPASGPTLQGGRDVQENPGEECLGRRENALNIVPLSTEVSVKRAGQLGPQLVGRRVP